MAPPIALKQCSRLCSVAFWCSCTLCPFYEVQSVFFTCSRSLFLFLIIWSHFAFDTNHIKPKEAGVVQLFFIQIVPSGKNRCNFFLKTLLQNLSYCGDVMLTRPVKSTGSRAEIFASKTFWVRVALRNQFQWSFLISTFWSILIHCNLTVTDTWMVLAYWSWSREPGQSRVYRFWVSCWG